MKLVIVNLVLVPSLVLWRSFLFLFSSCLDLCLIWLFRRVPPVLVGLVPVIQCSALFGWRRADNRSIKFISAHDVNVSRLVCSFLWNKKMRRICDRRGGVSMWQVKVNVNVAARCSSSHDVLVLLVLLCEDTRWPPDVLALLCEDTRWPLVVVDVASIVWGHTR